MLCFFCCFFQRSRFPGVTTRKALRFNFIYLFFYLFFTVENQNDGCNRRHFSTGRPSERRFSFVYRQTISKRFRVHDRNRRRRSRIRPSTQRRQSDFSRFHLRIKTTIKKPFDCESAVAVRSASQKTKKTRPGRWRPLPRCAASTPHERNMAQRVQRIKTNVRRCSTNASRFRRDHDAQEAHKARRERSESRTRAPKENRRRVLPAVGAVRCISSDARQNETHSSLAVPPCQALAFLFFLTPAHVITRFWSLPDFAGRTHTRTHGHTLAEAR